MLRKSLNSVIFGNFLYEKEQGAASLDCLTLLHVLTSGSGPDPVSRRAMVRSAFTGIFRISVSPYRTVARDTNPKVSRLLWYRRRDSNPHDIDRQILSLLCLPIPPRRQISFSYGDVLEVKHSRTIVSESKSILAHTTFSSCSVGP